MEHELGIKKRILEIILKESKINLPNDHKVVLQNNLNIELRINSKNTALEIFRDGIPQSSFIIYLTPNEVKRLANQRELSIDNFLFFLRTEPPKGFTANEFDMHILLDRVIPSLIDKIYTKYINDNFDSSNSDWANLHNYEVGLR
jgi:hypothetical protein